MRRLFAHLQHRREQRALRRRAIPDELWRLTLARMPFLAQLPAADSAELRRLSSLFLDRKEFSGAHGLQVSDDMAVAIAAQACLPVLRFGLAPYDGFVGIVVQPDEVRVRREVTDDDGIVHEYDDVLSGEAMDGGPVMLSWHDVGAAGESAAWGYNVVIHEFAHKLDMLGGEPNGCPPLHAGMALAAWRRAFSEAFDDFCRRVDEADASAQEDGGRLLEELPIDPYGSESPGEFFAVASEAFFETPELLEPAYPAVYAQLKLYYRQDPLARLAAAGG